MVNRITITLPTPLAEAIAALAIEHQRPPKDQIIWLLREAVRASTVRETHKERQTTPPLMKECAYAGKE